MNHHKASWLKKKTKAHDELAFQQSLLTYFSHYLKRTLQQEEKLFDLPDDSLQFLSRSHVPAFYNSNTISTNSHMNNCWSGNMSGCWGFNWGLCADWVKLDFSCWSLLELNRVTWQISEAYTIQQKDWSEIMDGALQATHAANQFSLDPFVQYGKAPA